MSRSRPRLTWNAAAIEQVLAAMMVRNINDSLAHLVKTAKKRLARGNASGRNPSKPGEYPKRVTGELGAAVGMDPAQREGNRIRGRFGVQGQSPAGPYARRQELGFVGRVEVPAHRRNTRVGFGGQPVQAYAYDINYEARPFIRPTVRTELALIGQVMMRAPGQRLRRSSGKAGS